MTLNEILAEVQDIVNRPDNRAATLAKKHITSAILKCHSIAEFRRDLVTLTLPDFTADATGIYSTDLPTRFRKIFRLIAIYSDGTKWCKFHESETEKFYNEYGLYSRNTWKIFGNTFHLSYQDLPTEVQMQYLAFPSVDWTAETPITTSFIADAYPFPIINYAAAKMFESLGDKESRSMYWQDYIDGRADLIRLFEQIPSVPEDLL